MKIIYLLCMACLGLCLPANAETKSLLDDSRNQDTEIEIPISRTDMTITESIQSAERSAQSIAESYQFGQANGELSAVIENLEAEHKSSSTQIDAKEHLRNVLIGFILELVLTLIVLHIAFSLSGFPSLFSQLALLSIVIAMLGAAMEYFLFIGLLNPIRIGLSFILLLLLIRQFTDAREWATAIRISLIARLISLVLMWLALAGLMALFGL
jgi:heme/copper-type cytochrome/quinol oxidase subunit 4